MKATSVILFTLASVAFGSLHPQLRTGSATLTERSVFQKRQATRDQVVNHSFSRPAVRAQTSGSPSMCGTDRQFYLQFVDRRGALDGDYATAQYTSRSNAVITHADQKRQATVFKLNSQCNLVNSKDSSIANIDDGSSLFVVYLSPSGEIAAQGYESLVCNVRASALSCSAGSETVFQICSAHPDWLAIGDSLKSGCRRVALQVVSA